MSSYRIVGALLVVLVCAFLVLPLVVIIGASFGTDPYLKFPPSGITLSWYRDMLGLEEFVQPLWVSLRLAFVVAVLASLSGALAAYALARSSTLRHFGLETVFLFPIVLPSLVVGLALLVFFNVLGITNSWVTLFFGHAAVTIPIVFRTSASLVGSLDRNLELAALTLGARPRSVVVKVVLPLLRPAIVAGFVMAFALSFDEFVISVLLSNAGVTTFPVALYSYMRFSLNPTLAAISTVLVIATCAVIFLLHRLINLEVLFGLREQQR